MEVNVQHKQPNQAYLCVRVISEENSCKLKPVLLPVIRKRLTFTALLGISVSLGLPEDKHIIDGYSQSSSNTVFFPMSEKWRR